MCVVGSFRCQFLVLCLLGGKVSLLGLLGGNVCLLGLYRWQYVLLGILGGNVCCCMF